MQRNKVAAVSTLSVGWTQAQLNLLSDVDHTILRIQIFATFKQNEIAYLDFRGPFAGIHALHCAISPCTADSLRKRGVPDRSVHAALHVLKRHVSCYDARQILLFEEAKTPQHCCKLGHFINYLKNSVCLKSSSLLP